MTFHHKLLKFKIATVAFGVALALCLPGSHVSAASATSIVIVSVPSQSVSPGSEFTLNVTVQPTSAIAGAQFNLSFNPALVTVKNVREGNLLKQNGDSTYFSPGRIDNTVGIITGVAGTITSPGKTVSSEGILAVITMIAGSTDANCPINLSKVILGDVKAQSLPTSTVNATITIGNGTNQPPILGPIGNKTINAGSLLTFVVSGTDPENDPLTYSASHLPAGAIFYPSTRTFSWTPTSSQAGIYSNVSIEATDGSLSDTENITIVVTSPAPVSPGGGFGGLGGGGEPMPPGPLPPAPTTFAQSDNRGVINTAIDIGSEDGLARVMIDSSTKGLTKDGKSISTIAIVAAPNAPILSEKALGIGKTYDIEPDGATFDRPVKLIFSYDPSLIPQIIDENTLVLATFDILSGKWVDLPGIVNSNNHTLTAQTNHFSLYRVLSRAQPGPSVAIEPTLPTDLESAQSALIVKTIDVSTLEVFVGETITITAVLTNENYVPTTNDIVLRIDGVIEGQKKVTVGAALEEKAVFEITKDEPGAYAVDINGAKATFVVRLPVPTTEASTIQTKPTSPNVLPSPTVATAKTFSLSLLSQIIGLAFLFICVTLITVVVRRNQLLKRDQY
jgi:hypothetical protein